jgi:hypothetical protein
MRKTIISAAVLVAMTGAASAMSKGVPSAVMAGPFCYQLTVGGVKYAIPVNDATALGKYLTALSHEADNTVVTVTVANDAGSTSGFPQTTPCNNNSFPYPVGVGG